MKAKEMITCTSCGAEFDASLVRCPYCGTGYAPAEEEEYMGRLEGIRTDLERHQEDADKSLKKGMGVTAFTVVLVVAGIILLLSGGLWFSGKWEQNKAEQAKQEFLREQGIETGQEETAK